MFVDQKHRKSLRIAKLLDVINIEFSEQQVKKNFTI